MFTIEDLQDSIRDENVCDVILILSYGIQPNMDVLTLAVYRRNLKIVRLIIDNQAPIWKLPPYMVNEDYLLSQELYPIVDHLIDEYRHNIIPLLPELFINLAKAGDTRLISRMLHIYPEYIDGNVIHNILANAQNVQTYIFAVEYSHERQLEVNIGNALMSRIGNENLEDFRDIVEYHHAQNIPIEYKRILTNCIHWNLNDIFIILSGYMKTRHPDEYQALIPHLLDIATIVQEENICAYLSQT